MILSVTYHFLLKYGNRIRSPGTLTATVDYGRTETRYIDFDTLLANLERAIELSVSKATEVRMMYYTITEQRALANK